MICASTFKLIYKITCVLLHFIILCDWPFCDNMVKPKFQKLYSSIFFIFKFKFVMWMNNIVCWSQKPEFIRIFWSPGWCSSVDWAWVCEPNHCLFNSQSGHIPGCRPCPQQKALKRQPHIDVPLPLFLPPFLSLKINK